MDVLSGRRLDTSSQTYFDLAAAFLYHNIERRIHELELDRTSLAYRYSTSALRNIFLGNRVSAAMSIKWPTTEYVRGDGFSTFSAMVLKMINIFTGRRGFSTKKGYLGVGPPGLLQGDIVSVLQGFRLPVILRKVGSQYVLVGTCFVLGLMDEEAMQAVEQGSAQLQEIEIQ